MESSTTVIAPPVGDTPVVQPPSNPWSKAGASPAWPWGSPATIPAPCSLEDVMSEELAKELEAEEKSFLHSDRSSSADVDLSEFMISDDVDTKNDLLLAQMMQHEFDIEHDQMLKKEEAKYNANSKVSISFKNFRSIHPALQGDEDSESSDDFGEDEDEKEDRPHQFKKTGISGKGKNIITKHDPTICGTKNTKKVMEQFPPEFASGFMETKLPNQVYNQLKIHSHVDAKRGHRLHEKKEHATAEMAVDEKTRLIMYKLVNSEVLENISGAISAGKESVVFHANGGSMTDALVPKECAIKVFKTTLAGFKNRAIYVKGDIRYFKDQFKKQNPRRIIKIWAEKEENNLRRLEKYGIPVPRVVVLKKHVLVMEFIGERQQPAPKLKDAKLSFAEMQLAYEQCIENMKKMYQVAGLVHADLSEYNMLWHKDQLYFIDVSQAVERFHPGAMEFLLRDCTNICEFFTKARIPDVPSPYQLFNFITGLDLQGEGKDFLAQIEDYEKNEETLRLEGSMTNYPFEFFFAKSVREREAGKQNKDNSEDEEESEECDKSEIFNKDSHVEKSSSEKDSNKDTAIVSHKTSKGGGGVEGKK